MRHVHTWVISHTNDSWHIRMSPGTYGWVMARIRYRPFSLIAHAQVGASHVCIYVCVYVWFVRIHKYTCRHICMHIYAHAQVGFSHGYIYMCLSIYFARINTCCAYKWMRDGTHNHTYIYMWVTLLFLWVHVLRLHIY